MQSTLQSIQPTRLTDYIGELPTDQTIKQGHPIHYTSVLVNIFIFNYTISFTTQVKETRFNFYKTITNRFNGITQDPKVVYGNYNKRGRVLSWRFSIHASPAKVIAFLTLIRNHKRIVLTDQVLRQIDLMISTMRSHQRQGIKRLMELRSTNRDGNPLGLLDGIHTTTVTFVDDHGNVVEKHRVFYPDIKMGATTHECGLKMFLACADVSTSAGVVHRDDLTHFNIHIKHMNTVIETIEEFGMKLSAIPPFGKNVVFPKGSCLFGVLITNNRLTSLSCHTSHAAQLN